MLCHDSLRFIARVISGIYALSDWQSFYRMLDKVLEFTSAVMVTKE